MSELPTNLKFIAIALVRAGGEADLSEIYKPAAIVLPNWAEYYKNEESFRGTIRHTLECYCPQSQNYREERDAFFEKVAPGRYRLVNVEDRETVKRRGRTLS
jgi:hypothetical protein